MANPMDAPVMTGPSFGISAWGLEDFLVQKGRPRGDLLVFEQDDFVYDHCDETTWGSYAIEFFIFTMYFQPFVRQIGRTRFELPLWHNQFHSTGRSFQLQRLSRLGQQPYFLGAICLRRPSWPRRKIRLGHRQPGALESRAHQARLHAHYPAMDGRAPKSPRLHRLNARPGRVWTTGFRPRLRRADQAS